MTKILLESPPYRQNDAGKSWLTRGVWPASWVSCRGVEAPFVAAYRCRFQVNEPVTIRVHVSADERYQLFFDGERIGVGPERGDPANWFFDSYELSLTSGNHVLVARVWALGFAAPRAQMSANPGFLLSPDSEDFLGLLGTGNARWEAKPIGGYSFERPFAHDFFSIGYNTRIDGNDYAWGFERGEGENWEPVEILHAGSDAVTRTRIGPTVHRLRPATLPPLLDKAWHGGRVRFVSSVDDKTIPIRKSDNLPQETLDWEKFWSSSEAINIPAHSKRRVLIDLQTYLTANVELETLGGCGSQVCVHWAESLFHEFECKNKGHRGEIEGKYFVGIGDVFEPDGGENRVFESLLWRAGRYLELRIQTGDEPLTLKRLTLRETRYPLEMESHFESDDTRIERIFPLGVRTLQASCQDAFIDGPYYEQMMWAGDGVQDILTTFVLTRDDLPARRWMSLFDNSRDASGLTCARWPARDRLVIAPYSLYWAQMAREYAYWRDDAAFAVSMLAGVRGVLDAFHRFRSNEGLLRAIPGWNFVDWAQGWDSGTPPEGDVGVSSILNWHLVWALMQCAELEAAVGEPELEQLYRRRARQLANRISEAFWNEERGLFADNLEQTSFSEHAQCFAILSGLVSLHQRERISQALIRDTDLTRTTISFTHYLFETYRILGHIDALFERLELWFGLEEQGFYTLPEGPEPSRSDCHAWGTHPLFHAFATLGGIRPASKGFSTVIIEPQLGPLSHLKCVMPHPKGEIALSVLREDNGLRITVTLPDSITGTLIWEGKEVVLRAGEQSFNI